MQKKYFDQDLESNNLLREYIFKDKYIPFYNVLNIEYIFSAGSRLAALYKALECHRNAHLNYVEFGVFNGRSLLAVAIVFKVLNISGSIIGLDSFEGFPAYSPEDEIDLFKSDSRFEGDLVAKHEILKRLRGADSVRNISGSGEFTACSEAQIRAKIDLLGLDNISLLVGDFSDTVDQIEPKLLGEHPLVVNIDCDLYGGYVSSLNWIASQKEVCEFVFLDEYYSLKFPGARIAVDSFLEENQDFKLIQASACIENFPRWFLERK